MAKTTGLYIAYIPSKGESDVFTNKRGVCKFVGISVDTLRRKLIDSDIATGKDYIIWSNKSILTGKQTGHFR